MISGKDKVFVPGGPFNFKKSVKDSGNGRSSKRVCISCMQYRPTNEIDSKGICKRCNNKI